MSPFSMYGNYLQYKTLNLPQMYERLTSENTTAPVILLVSFSEENRVVIYSKLFFMFLRLQSLSFGDYKDHGNIGIEHRQMDVECGNMFLKCGVQCRMHLVKTSLP